MGSRASTGICRRVYGGSIDDLGYDDSNNVSLGAASPLSFDRGGSRFKQWTTNLDLTREIRDRCNRGR